MRTRKQKLKTKRRKGIRVPNNAKSREIHRNTFGGPDIPDESHRDESAGRRPRVYSSLL